MTGDLQSQTLEERVAALEELVQDLGEGVAQEVDDIKAAVLELAGVGPASGADGNGAEAPPAMPWAARASAEDWRELAGWVDWLAATYDLQPSRAVLPCWPAHGGVVHELAALRTAWTSAATTDASDEPGDAMTSWHERSLRPCLNRLREDYQLRACADRHVPPRPGRATEPALLATALVHAAATSAGADHVDCFNGKLR